MAWRDKAAEELLHSFREGRDELQENDGARGLQVRLISCGTTHL